MMDLLSAVQITGALIVERLRVLKTDIGIREFGHPDAPVESTHILSNVARQPLEIAIPLQLLLSAVYLPGVNLAGRIM